MNKKETMEKYFDIFKSKKFISDITAGLILAVINITFSISLAAFVFSGKLIEYFPIGAGLILISCVIINIILSKGSSFKGIISAPQSIIITIVAYMAANITNDLLKTGSSLYIFPTILAAIIISTVMSGIFLYLLGKFQIGDLFRFIPYPVIGGQFAGVGLLLIIGAIKVITGIPLNIDNFKHYLEIQPMIYIILSIIFALALFTIHRRYKNYFLIPTLIILVIAGFHIFLFIKNIISGGVSETGLFVSGLSNHLLWKPSVILNINNADWIEIANQFGSIITIMFVTVLAFLIKATGIEIGSKKDIDLNHDLMVTGIANIFSGLAGGTVAFNSTSGTILAHKIGARSRMTGVYHAAFCMAAIYWGTLIISFIPRPVIGGILLFLGISFLFEWLYKTFFTLPKSDYYLIIVIFLAVVFTGFIKAVGLGILISAILFVVNYSRTNVIKYEFSGIYQRSKVDRANIYEQILKDNGYKINIIVLQGFIFFGTAN